MSDFKFKVSVLGFSEKVLSLLDFSRILWDHGQEIITFGLEIHIFGVGMLIIALDIQHILVPFQPKVKDIQLNLKANVFNLVLFPFISRP